MTIFYTAVGMFGFAATIFSICALYSMKQLNNKQYGVRGAKRVEEMRKKRHVIRDIRK